MSSKKLILFEKRWSMCHVDSSCSMEVSQNDEGDNGISILQKSTQFLEICYTTILHCWGFVLNACCSNFYLPRAQSVEKLQSCNEKCLISKLINAIRIGKRSFLECLCIMIIIMFLHYFSISNPLWTSENKRFWCLHWMSSQLWIFKTYLSCTTLTT